MAGAAVLVAAVVVGILGCEQNATREAAVKPAAGQHIKTPKPKYAGPHTEGPTATPLSH